MKNRNAMRCYLSIEGKKETIPANNKKLINKLAYKRYAEVRLNLLKTELVHLKTDTKIQKKAQATYDSFLESKIYSDLVAPQLSSIERSHLEWMNEPFPSNPKFPENKTHETVRKLMVRSKAESMIALSLDRHNIPFRYECQLELNGIIIYPDFTIINPRTGQTMYWEHFGRMDELDYQSDFSLKMKTYSTNRIILGDNLIGSFETRAMPLSYATIEKLINTFIFD